MIFCGFPAMCRRAKPKKGSLRKMKKTVSKIKTKTVLYALCAILCAAPLMMCPPSVEASNDATVKSYKDQLAVFRRSRTVS